MLLMKRRTKKASYRSALWWILALRLFILFIEFKQIDWLLSIFVIYSKLVTGQWTNWLMDGWTNQPMNGQTAFYICKDLKINIFPAPQIFKNTPTTFSNLHCGVDKIPLKINSFPSTTFFWGGDFWLDYHKGCSTAPLQTCSLFLNHFLFLDHVF